MEKHPLQVLLVEDDTLAARLLKADVEHTGAVRVRVAGSAEDALDLLVREPCDAVLTDLVLPGADGVELIRAIREWDPTLPVVMLTAFATADRAAEAIRAGATEFLPKPANAEALVALLERAVAECPLREKLWRQSRVPRASAVRRLVQGDHPKLDEVRRFAERVAAVPAARVLITGESGTGKSLLAEAIHEASDPGGRFVELNCAAVPDSLLESELFGHEKGAFTDAKSLKKGLVEAAHRGTLLLDEIGAMPLELQAKLLLFLERQEIRRVGGTHPVPVRCRVIAATNQDLQALAKDGRFRRDLLYRLDVASIHIPPLREMPPIIPVLGAAFARRWCDEARRPVPPIDELTFAGSESYAWPGNGRELRNAVERALIFHDDGPLRVPVPTAQAGPVTAGADSITLPLGLSLEAVERVYVVATLAGRRDGELSDAARELGISRKTLWDKRKRYGLE